MPRLSKLCLDIKKRKLSPLMDISLDAGKVFCFYPIQICKKCRHTFLFYGRGLHQLATVRQRADARAFHVCPCMSARFALTSPRRCCLNEIRGTSTTKGTLLRCLWRQEDSSLPPNTQYKLRKSSSAEERCESR